MTIFHFRSSLPKEIIWNLDQTCPRKWINEAIVFSINESYREINKKQKHPRRKWFKKLTRVADSESMLKLKDMPTIYADTLSENHSQVIVVAVAFKKEHTLNSVLFELITKHFARSIFIRQCFS